MCKTPFFPSECICCCVCLWTPDSSFFHCSMWTHTSDSLGSLGLGHIMVPLVLRLPGSWTEQLPGSLLLQYAIIGLHGFQLWKSIQEIPFYKCIFSIGSVPLEIPDWYTAPAKLDLAGQSREKVIFSHPDKNGFSCIVNWCQGKTVWSGHWNREGGRSPVNKTDKPIGAPWE